ncbi:MAG: hypothetical protein ACLFM4_03790 [Phormidium sp.]|jgi:hypothetical protein|nr:MAG: hypothetical protein HLUCCO16_08570 [Phormidium sp. OSCR]OAB57028.1 hypothetical protein AY600_03470 [Phormidium willei BDU 130791]
MLPKVRLLPGAISEILVSVRETGVLTRSDCYGLMAASLDESVTEQDRRSINRLIRSVRRGKVQIIDDLTPRR